MRKIGALLLISCLLGCQHEEEKTPGARAEAASVAVATPSDEARVAAGRAAHGDYYANRVAEILEDLRTRQPGGIVLLGDSITQQLPEEEFFPGRNVMNQGIGGDRVKGMVDRLDLVARARPSAIYLMAGCNDTNFPVGTREELWANYEALTAGLKEAAPKAKVTIMSVLPFGSRLEKNNPFVHEANALLAGLARKHGYRFVDLTPWVTDEQGNLRDDYTSDAVHLTARGYEAWMEAVLPPDELLPAMEAFAPRWRQYHAPERRANKVDPTSTTPAFAGDRGEHELVVYTPKYGKPSTGTNQYGSEAVVEEGRVTAILGNDSPIPSNGFVVSGHGSSAAWVVSTLRVGRLVSLQDGVVRVEGPHPADMTPAQKLDSMTDRLMMALPEKSEGRDRKVVEEAVRELQAVRSALRAPASKDLAALEEKIEAVENIRRAKK